MAQLALKHLSDTKSVSERLLKIPDMLLNENPQSVCEVLPQICVVYGQVVRVGQCQGRFGQVGFLLPVHRCGEGRLLRDGCRDGCLKQISY